MTDRYSSFIVHLKKDVRSDDCDNLKIALSSLKGVIKVEGLTSDPLAGSTEYIRARQEIIDKLIEIIRE